MVGAFRPSTPQISVESNGLVCSLGMLFAMLLILYGSVALFGWKMSNNFGISMIFSYIIFCALSILLEVELLTCPLKQLSISC
jgi:sodium/potassium/calcium exchanger 2